MTRWKAAVGRASCPLGTTRLSSSSLMKSSRAPRNASTSTSQPLRTASVSRSSVSASGRCARIAYSWARWRARIIAWCRAFSSPRENEGIGQILLLFHHALQRVLVLACRVHHARDLGFGHFVWIDAALPDPVIMDVQHDPHRVFSRLVEDVLQDE